MPRSRSITATLIGRATSRHSVTTSIWWGSMLQRNSEELMAPRTEQIGLAVADAAGPTVDLREIGRILRRRWSAIGYVAAAIIGLALLYVMLATTRYTATSTVVIDPRHANVVDSNTQPVLSSYGTDDATIESQALLIQSVATLQRVVDRLKLTEDEEFSPQPGFLDPVRRIISS